MSTLEDRQRFVNNMLVAARDGGLEITLPDNDYVLSENGAWFSLGGFAVRLHKGADGIICDVFLKGQEDTHPVTTCYAYDSDVEAA